jgi:selenide,water dikinase
MAMAHALRDKAAKLCLIERSMALSTLNGTAQRLTMEALTDWGIDVIENCEISAVAADHVLLEDGRSIAADLTFGAAAAKPHGWLRKTGLELHNGFIAIDRDLRGSDPAVFAVGDCAHMTHTPRPKAGVFAVRQATVLYDNLRAAMSGRALRHYRPQRDYLKLVSLGGKEALAERFGTAAKGPRLWQWKNWIDRKFMEKFKDLPAMKGPEVPLTVALGMAEALGDKPMCGGCGAKVGRAALREVLGKLPVTKRSDVESVAGDDAAVLNTGGARQVVTTDHLRAFTNDHALMTRIAAVHALGDVWAMGALPQAALVSLILPWMSAEMQARTLAEVMAVAAKEMTAAGAAIVGGHTSLGDEFTVGFTVTGLVDRAITLAGARPGDALILTKPLGSGVLMAAEMAGQGHGKDIIAAYATMAQRQGAAAAILADAHAMTDVTGFGLAGHLAGICDASGVAAEVELARVPLMPGALEMAERGMRSTLYSDNRTGVGEITGVDGPRADMMFDPQTAGGLLAAVDPGSAKNLLAGLLAKGYHAAIIGRIVAGEPAITLR